MSKDGKRDSSLVSRLITSKGSKSKVTNLIHFRVVLYNIRVQLEIFNIVSNKLGKQHFSFGFFNFRQPKKFRKVL